MDTRVVGILLAANNDRRPLCLGHELNMCLDGLHIMDLLFRLRLPSGPNKPRPHLTRFVLALIVILLSMTCSTVTTYADSPNARITGEVQKLLSVVAQAAPSCASYSCGMLTSPIRLSVRASPRLRYQVKLTSIKIPTSIVRSQGFSVEEDYNSRPILLRGDAYVRRNNKRHLPIAATLYRDTNTPVLEISALRLPRKSSAKSEGLVVVRATIDSLARRAGNNARAQVSSSFAFTQRGCHIAKAPQSFLQTRSNSDSSWVHTQATYNVLYIATDYDPQFASKTHCSSSSSCKNKILSIVNQAAVFYERQLGYTLEVARQFGPTNYGTSTYSGTVLDDFQQHNATSRLQYLHTGTNTTDNQVDLFQLFTGRSMDDDVIGIAYESVICRNDQSDFADAAVARVSDTLDPVTTAHEVGHTLSAGHTSSGIMKASLGSPPPQSFANSSLLAISNFLGDWYSQCRQGTSSGSETTTPTPTPADGSGASGEPNPFQGKPVTVVLQAQRPGKRTLRLTSTVTSIAPNCSVKIRAGTSSVASLRGIIVAEFTPTELTRALSAKVSVGVKPTKSTGANIFLVAEHSCLDGTIIEVSPVKRFNPNKVKGVKKQVSKGRWIRGLQKALQ